MLARTPGQRRVPAGKEDEMIEVRAREAKGPFPFHAQEAALPELASAFRTRGIPEDRKDDDVRPGLTAARGVDAMCGPCPHT